MPVMKGSTAVAANATNQNALDEYDFEFMPYDGLVSVVVAQSATGLEVDVKATSESLAAAVVPNIVAATGRVQTDTDTILNNEPVPKGKRLKLLIRNTTAGSLTLHWVVNVDRWVG